LVDDGVGGFGQEVGEEDWLWLVRVERGWGEYFAAFVDEETALGISEG